MASKSTGKNGKPFPGTVTSLKGIYYVKCNMDWNQGIVEEAVYLDSMKENGGMGLGFSHRYIAKYN